MQLETMKLKIAGLPSANKMGLSILRVRIIRPPESSFHENYTHYTHQPNLTTSHTA